MSHGLPLQYSQARSSYAPNSTLFPGQQLGQPGNTSSWPEVMDDVEANLQGQAPTGRSAPGTEHTKHRRTRSGCYTCRQRRVKCDEARPICDRCVKGSRPCTYPEPKSKASSSKSASSRSTAPIPELSSSDEGGDEVDESKDISALNTSQNDNGQKGKGKSARKPPRTKTVASRKSSIRGHKQPLPSIEQSEQEAEAGQSPPTDASSPSRPASRSSRHLENITPESSISPEKISLSHLPHLERHYLEYLRNYLSYHHYFFRNDANYFVRHILIEQALSYEPLLQAVVGFAAFHEAMRKPNGRIQDFLGFYSRSVSLLRKSLINGEKHTEATLLTILQLATIEEYLGDWVNLLGHHKAAYSILTEIHSIESVVDSELSRKILSWYARFDLFAGFMSGYETVLGREWFAANEQYYAEQEAQHPDSIFCRIEAAVAKHRILAMDMALLFAKLSRGAISMPDFGKENEMLAARISGWKKSLEPLLSDDRYLVESFEGAPARAQDDIVDPYRPGGLRQGPLWALNFLMVDGLSTTIMHTYQTALIMQRKDTPDGLEKMALETCRLFEAVEYWPGSPSGSILSAQAGLGIAVIFLPQDERHIMWCRRKLAKIEAQGYTYPPTFRAKMANLWKVDGVHHWWLPNEEGYPEIVRSIRTFIEDRSKDPRKQPPMSADIKSMKGLFDKLNID